MKVTDQLNRAFYLPETPKRIISLVPSLTELICDLNLEDSLVGITKFCVHPYHIRKEKTIVGGTKQVKVQLIKALRPDIIIANKEENTPEIIYEIEKIAPVYISDINTLNDCFTLILSLGKIFNRVELADSLHNQLQTKLQDFKAFVRNKPQLSIAYFIWRNPWMVAASHTFIDDIITLNNFKNIFAHKERYPEIQLEELKKLNVEVILLSSEPFPFKQQHVEEIEQELPNVVIKLVDGELFSWYGTRLLKSFDYFKRLSNDIR